MTELLSLPWKEFGLLAAGALLAAGGFFIKRIIRREHVTERLERRSKTIELYKLLQNERLTIADADRLEESLSSRRRRTFELQNETASALNQPYDDKPPPGMAQQEMNRSAAADLTVAEAELKRACLQLSFHLDANEQAAFDVAQKAWGRFSDAEARFEAAQFEGGSMQAGIFSSAKTELVIRRIAEIKSTIEDRQRQSDR